MPAAPGDTLRESLVRALEHCPKLCDLIVVANLRRAGGYRGPPPQKMEQLLRVCVLNGQVMNEMFLSGFNSRYNLDLNLILGDNFCCCREKKSTWNLCARLSKDLSFWIANSKPANCQNDATNLIFIRNSSTCFYSFHNC